MATPHTWASRLAGVMAGVLGVLQLGWAARTTSAPMAAVAAVLGVLTMAATLELARDSCFESRLAAVVLAGSQLTIGVLAVTVGLPGQPPQHTDPVALAAIGVATLVLVLVALDARLRRRRTGAPGPRPGYAL